MYPTLFTEVASTALIAHALRIAPVIDPDDYQNMNLTTIAKELSAATTKFPHIELDFRCIFSSDPYCRGLPICERVCADEEVACDTYLRMCNLRSKLSNHAFIPKKGSKSVGRIVAENFWYYYTQLACTFKHDGTTQSDVNVVTSDDCLRMYLESGGYVDGPVEVRSSWKYAQITPRIYYAKGGSVQYLSQYMQEIINIIIDEFPEVHRVNRFSNPTDTLTDDDVEIIYDYTSFTSNLDAVVPFLDSMSNFFMGVNIYLLDPIEGLVPYDLGQYFADYNLYCNMYRDFDISRLSVLSGGEDPIFQHTCGMLGIEGNIFIGTLLHGLFLRFVAGMNRSKCVGDDARLHFTTRDGLLSDDDRLYAFHMLSSIGEMNIEKVTAFEARSDSSLQIFRYLKRPFHRDIEIMVSGYVLTIPSQIPLVGLLDPYHTIIPSKTHPCRNVFKQIVRFFDELAIHRFRNFSESDNHVDVLKNHIAYLVRILRKEDKDGCYSEIGRTNYKTYYRIPPYDVWGHQTYVEWLMSDMEYDEKIRFPKYGGAEENGSCDGRAGSLMIRHRSKLRSLLERLGYLRSRMLYDEYSVDDVGLDLFEELMRGQYNPVVEYLVVKDVPTWYTPLPNSL